MVQNAHFGLKYELKHFTTPYMQLPPPAVLHDKAKRTQQGNLLHQIVKACIDCLRKQKGLKYEPQFLQASENLHASEKPQKTPKFSRFDAAASFSVMNVWLLRAEKTVNQSGVECDRHFESNAGGLLTKCLLWVVLCSQHSVKNDLGHTRTKLAFTVPFSYDLWDNVF